MVTPSQGRTERAVRRFLRDNGFKVEDDTSAARALTLAIHVDTARSASAAAAADKQLGRVLAGLELAASARNPKPSVRDTAAEDVPADVTPPTSLVDRLRRPS